MESLIQSARRREDGEALPTVFPQLASEDIHFYRGAVVLTAAAPGVGKSVFALKHAIECGVPALYVCMDTTRSITVTRAGMMATHQRSQVVEAQLENETSQVHEALRSVDHIGAFYRAGIDSSEIVDMLGAFAEIRGEFPHLMIVDNLLNFSHPEDAKLQAHQRIVSELDIIAKDANVCVHLLTHVSGNYKSGLVPIPQDGIMNKLTELPHTVLTLTRSSLDNSLMAAAVKIRTAPFDASGESRIRIPLNFDTMSMPETESVSHEVF